MLLTIFQYIPVSEDETQSDNFEMSKKAKESNDTSGDDDAGEDDTDEKNNDDKVVNNFDQNYFSKLSSLNAFYIKSNNYKYPDKTVKTPPPKLV